MPIKSPEVSVNPAVIAFLDRISAHFGERYLFTVLYGSHARGEGTPESDIDLLVILSSISNYERDWEDCIDLASEIASNTGDLISVLVCSAEDYENREHPLLMNIRKEGSVLR
jgi:predicted nucleotidyltransferase